jgi:hypothetical protein
MGCEDIGLAVTAGVMMISNSIMNAIFCRNEGQVTAVFYLFAFAMSQRQGFDKMASASALLDRMPRLARPYIICVLPRANNQANAQAGATPPPASQQEAAQYPASGNEQPASAPSGASEVCRTLEQAAAENGLPVEFLPVLFGKRAVSTPLP